MAKINTDTKDELEKFRLRFSGCANPDVAPLTKRFFKVTLRTILRLIPLCREQVFPVQGRSQTASDVDEPRSRPVRPQSPGGQ